MPITRSVTKRQANQGQLDVATPAGIEVTHHSTPATIKKLDEALKTTEGIVTDSHPPSRPVSMSGNHRKTSSKADSKKSKQSERALQLARAKLEFAAAQVALLEAEAQADQDNSDTETELSEADNELSERERVKSWLLKNDQAFEKQENEMVKTEPKIHPATVPACSEVQREPKQQNTDCSTSRQQIDLTELARAIATAAKSGSQSTRQFAELPPYYGSHQEWLSFKSAYLEASNQLSEAENLSRLRRSLRGRAREAVENLLIYNANSNTIIEALESRFGRPDVIALSELERLRGLPRPTDAPREVCIFASRISNVVATLQALNKPHYLHSPEAVKATVEKLTTAMKYRWFDFAAEQSTNEAELLKLSRFLRKEADRCGPYAEPENVNTDTVNRRVQRTFSAVNKPPAKCFICSREGHFASQCKKFTEAEVSSRWELAKTHRLCFACLNYKSKSHQCRRVRCGTNGCQHYHHKLLHFVRTENRENNKAEKRETVQSTWSSKKTFSYLKILPVKVSGPAGDIETFALLDDGSTISLIDEDVARLTGLRGPIDPLSIEAFASNRVSASKSRRVKLKLCGALRNYDITANTIENMKLSTQTVSTNSLNHCEHLQDIVQYLHYKEASPKVLIGQDNWQLLLATEVRKGHQSQPIASLSPLGWVLHGAQTRILGQTVNFVNHVHSREEAIDEQLRKYFTEEALMIEPRRPQNDPEFAVYSKLNEYSKETVDGHYEVPLLWKNEMPAMPDNYENTLKRLYNIEKKLDRDPDLKLKYNEQMKLLIEKKYAEPAPAIKTENRTWYLPHFAVLNPMKPGKVRIVHDAAAKTKGVSLNDHLMTGPDLLQSLPGVLMRFRQHRIAVTADIREMFMQVKITPRDRDALRYLWRGDRRDDKPPEEYRMTSLIFGASCSPSIAIFVKNTNAAKYENKHPEASAAIIRNHYVDDYLHSYKTEEEAIKTAQEVRDIHLQAHYELRQWTSNSSSVIEALDPNATQPQKINIDSESKTERVLGLIWKPATDELTFNLNLSRLPQGVLENEEPTKREILKIMMSIFDPLGFASIITVNAKAILQEVWRRGTAWDEKIDRDLAQKWKNWIENMKKLNEMNITRCYLQYSNAESRQLHVFVDASETAYAAILFWRITTNSGEVYVSFITSKAKVAPLKTTSIPRLELQAAVMGSKIATTVIEEHDEKPESKLFWTDNRTVLTWIQKGSRTYKPYVAHRIAAIEENSTVHEWRWIPTSLNVADDATREVPRDFSENHRWFQGPSFLRDDPSTWPTQHTIATELTGEEKVNLLAKTENRKQLGESVPDHTRFSRWERLLRSTARVLQFIEMCQKRNQKINYKRSIRRRESEDDWNKQKRTNLTDKKQERERAKLTERKRSELIERERKYRPIQTQLLQHAEELLIKKCQQESFNEEIERMSNNRSLSNNSRLRNLSTELVNGIVTLRTRIAATRDITEQQKRPPVLDGNHYIVKLYIDYVHRQLHHGGVETTINECKQRYWILRVRPVTRMTIHRCLKCRIKKASPPEPPTGDLPKCRLAHHQRPFTYSGLDNFGPLFVTVNRSRQKRYVALFTCLTSRAVHLELVASMNAESAVMALRRMIARRGCPTEIWSDNGTNFHGANREIQDVMEQEASKKKFTWRFIPPGAPFMGGAWERLVRSVKTALYSTLNERYPTEEVLSTLLAEVEFTVNSRPLTYVSVDPSDPEALTPNHFLLHGPAREPSLGTFSNSDLIGRTHWRASQRLAVMFWNRWVKEYLPSLQHRREAQGKGDPLKLDDVVLIVDGTLPRNTWPMGIVTAVYPGPDGVVRTADVRTRGHTLRRPTKKLVIIPTESSRSPCTS